MYACPRAYCGGSLIHFGGQVQCVLCARGLVLARPPNAEELRSRKPGVEQPTDYTVGIYAVGQSEAMKASQAA